MKKTALIAAAFSTSLVAAAGTLAAQETIKIGGIAPLSPPGGVQTGESLRDGMVVAVEELNANGGIIYDRRGKPMGARSEDGATG